MVLTFLFYTSDAVSLLVEGVGTEKDDPSQFLILPHGVLACSAPQSQPESVALAHSSSPETESTSDSDSSSDSESSSSDSEANDPPTRASTPEVTVSTF